MKTGNNKELILKELHHLATEGIEFPDYRNMVTHVDKVIPSELALNNTKLLLEICSDEDLYRWEASLYVNGSILLMYVDENREDPNEKVSAMINVAEASLSGFFSYKDEYFTLEERADNIFKFIDIFKKVRLARTKAPDTQTLLKIFRMFDEHGLIKDDLCFDPEHFMETVIREHWDDE